MSKVITDEKKIDELLSRGVDTTYPPREEFKKALRSGRELRVKLGIDPTGADLHLGHSVVLRKLRGFQDLGHTIVLIIGDFTAQIGDPSGVSKERRPLAPKEIKLNMKRYLSHAGKIIDVKKAEIKYNSKWLGKLGPQKMLELTSLVSVQQILERADFAERIREGKPLRLHETLYPLMQAYDSVMIKADIEIGGTDQTFNLLAGRSLMEKMGLSPQLVLTVPLLEGTDGVKKMSKSMDNYIALSDSSDDMYGKLMSISDNLIKKYFLLCTGLPVDEIETIMSAKNPRDAKARLALEIVKLYHGEKSAHKAGEEWTKKFSQKDFSGDIPELLAPREVSVLDLVVLCGVAQSKSEARRLIEQGGVSLGEKSLRDPNERVSPQGDEVLRVGKKHFFRIKI